MKNKLIQKIKIYDNEVWWGGAINHGINMPFNEKKYSIDLGIDIAGNQANPLLLSNKGRFVWSEKPYKIDISDGYLLIEGEEDEIVFGEHGNNLREVFKYVSKKYFPATGIMSDPLLITAPQYNTWIEMMYEPTEQKIIEYAESVLKNDMAPGILMIDDNWQEDYGTWEFRMERFPDPKKMVDKLHELGFKVMLWVCPFISPDSETFRFLEGKKYLIKNAKGDTAIRKWWNGYSAVLDCTNPEAIKWFNSKMEYLVNEYGIDGFKFDAGDSEFYENDDINYAKTDRNGQCEAWVKIGLRYNLNEYRACWKMAGQPLVQRLRDKLHSWGEDGLASLIPNGLAQGLMGYAFNCPDMIGGGDYLSFLGDSFSIDQELFVRYAQCSALFPMMQFSAAPWRVLDKEHLGYCVEVAKLHEKLGEDIIKIAVDSAKTGEPIMRHMEYEFPNEGYEYIDDQFILGSDILVAPVTQKGITERTIEFPKGKWIGDDGKEVSGPCSIKVSTPISRLPWYRKA